MPKLKIDFSEPEHGWIKFSMFDGEEQILSCIISDIYPSFGELVTALSTMLDADGECLVMWTEEPGEFELHFSRRGAKGEIWLEITSFSGYPDQCSREKRESDFSVTGSYEEICIPFWRALQDLKGLYSAKMLESEWHWTGYFPTRELESLTDALGKSK